MSEHTGPIKIGKRYRFDYPSAFTTKPDYTEHSGQMVTVLRALAEPEVDFENGPEGDDPMFLVRADDGWEGHAWSSELEGDGDNVPPTPDQYMTLEEARRLKAGDKVRMLCGGCGDVWSGWRPG